MRRDTLILFLALAVCGGCPAQDISRAGVTNAPNLRLRERPDLDAPVITLLGEGERVQVLDQTAELFRIGDMEAHWLQLRTAGGLTGWSYGRYVDVRATVAYLGVELLFDEAVAGGASGRVVPESEWGPTPAHVELTLQRPSDAESSGRFPAARIRIYPLDGTTEAILLAQDERLVELGAIIGGVGLPAEIRRVPEYPPVFAAQVPLGHMRRLEFRNGAGVRFLCVHSQGVFPPGGRFPAIEYIFEGLTADRTAFVHASIAVNHPKLGEIDLRDLEQRSLIGELASAGFVPTLDGLDEMFRSLRLAPTLDRPYQGWSAYGGPVRNSPRSICIAYPSSWSAEGDDDTIRLTRDGLTLTIRFGAHIPETERVHLLPRSRDSTVVQQGILPVLGCEANREAELVGQSIAAVSWRIADAPAIGPGAALVAELVPDAGAGGIDEAAIGEAERILGSIRLGLEESP